MDRRRAASGVALDATALAPEDEEQADCDAEDGEFDGDGQQSDEQPRTVN